MKNLLGRLGIGPAPAPQQPGKTGFVVPVKAGPVIKSQPANPQKKPPELDPIVPKAATQAPANADGIKVLDARSLRSIVTDAAELKKGAEIADKGGIEHLARHEDRLFCEAAGSGAAPYRVTVSLPKEGDVKARCNCMAARSRPICKHAAALLVAWTRAPESFVVSDAPPVAPSDGAKKTAAVKKGRVKTETLLATGVEQTLTLVRELAVSGVATSSLDRAQSIRGLAETLRANRLRRLSARVISLGDMLESAARRRTSPNAIDYADTVGDLLLAARRIERHLAGEALEPRYLEELVGRNWTKADRESRPDLRLAQYAFVTRVTPDEFVIRERRLVDIATGTHYSEKQILPAFLARRTSPLPSQAGSRIEGTGGVYPGFAPFRLDGEKLAVVAPLEVADIEDLLATLLDGPAAAMAAFVEQRRDVLAPDGVPVGIRAEAIVGIGDRLAVVGAKGDAMLLDGCDEVLDSLEGARLRAMLGDVDLDGILVELRPLAAIVATDAGLELREVIRNDALVARRPSADWMADARAAGASAAALSLAEIREELASVLVNGVGSLSDRLADPLATRMADLSLERPAALLREIATRPDPADRLDDLVRIHQVLGIGAVRLAGTRTVDLATLIEVPGTPAVRIADPGPAPSVVEVERGRAGGTISAWQASVLRHRALAAAAPEELCAPWPLWSNAAFTDAIVDAVANLPEPPYPSIDDALSLRWGLVPAITAVRILERVPLVPASSRLVEAAMARGKAPGWDWQGYLPDRAMRVVARRTRGSRTLPVRWPWASNASTDPAHWQALVEELANAGRRERRAEVALELADLEDPRALPALRLAWRSDAAPLVRQAAARALTSLGDVAIVEACVDAVVGRARDDERAKVAAYALGGLGDVRGIHALLDALAEGWKSNVVLEALGNSGFGVALTVIDRVLLDPPLSQRRGMVSALERQPAEAILGALSEALGRQADTPEGDERAHALLRLSACHKVVHRPFGQLVLERCRTQSKPNKALLRAAEKSVAGKAQPAK